MPRIEPLPWEALTPTERARMDHTIKHSGLPPDKTPGRIFAYALHEHVPDDGDRHYNYPRHLLPGKLLELLRIRSARRWNSSIC